jgi:hypothetical protein
MLLAAAAFVAAGGYVHLREWLDAYRDVPSSAPGATLVKVGFPLNAAVSALFVIGLVLAATKVPRLAAPVVVGAIAFQAGSLAVLIGSRVGTVLGWTEPVWTQAADQTRAVEIGALAALVGVLAVRRLAPAEPIAT